MFTSTLKRIKCTYGYIFKTQFNHVYDEVPLQNALDSDTIQNETAIYVRKGKALNILSHNGFSYYMQCDTFFINYKNENK